MKRRKNKMTDIIDNHQNVNDNQELTTVEEIETSTEELGQADLETQIKNEELDKKKNDNKAEVNPQKFTRRLVIVDGGKGGVGKSMWTRGFVQACIDESRQLVAVDADNSNPDLLRYYGNHCRIERLNIFKGGSIDKFFDKIKEMIEPNPDKYEQLPPSESLFLLELPPQSRQVFKEFIQRMEFLEIAEDDYDMRITMVVVISRVSDSVKQLIDLHSFCGSKVDYLIVKNLFFGEEEEFNRYNDSEEIKEIRKQLTAEKIPFIDITMPELIEHAYDYLDQHSLTFTQGTTQRDLPSVKGRVKNWIKTFKEEIEPVKHLLGLKSESTEQG